MKYINVIPPIYWPAHPDDPQGIRVASVFELFSVCSLIVCLSANFLIFYRTVQYSIVQYSTVQYKAAGVRKNVVRMNTDVLM